NEFDFYSAVDDLKEDDDEEGAGAGMLGTVLYNSSCYYRYANLDLRQLVKNLEGDGDSTMMAVRAFLTGMIHAVPTGKRTNSAPQNPPAPIMGVVRDKGLWSLANAFVSPSSGSRGGLLIVSGQRLLEHWNELVGMYDMDGIRYAGLATYLPLESIGLANGGTVTVERRVADLVDRVMVEVERALS